MKFLIFLSIIAASLGFGSFQIIGNPHQFNFIVGINSGQLQCAGSLISRRAILTSSDCMRTTMVEVIFGVHDISATFENNQVRLSYGRESFRFEGPVGIIVLDPPFAFFSQNINSIDLPLSQPNERFANVPSQAAGFLINNPNPNNVRFWNVMTINNNDCPRGQNNPIPNYMMCLSNNNGCTLVPGSPLFIPNGRRFSQIGIQNSDPCGNNNDRVRFIRVTEFISFIRRHM